MKLPVKNFYAWSKEDFQNSKFYKKAAKRFKENMFTESHMLKVKELAKKKKVIK